MNPRTRALLEAPILPTLLRLGAPNVAVMLAQAGVGLIETYFVGQLGTDALAGMALVFPLVMLMQTTSAGAMGGGIASAIARALGARRSADANALVLHAVVVALGFGLLFTAAMLGGGRWIYTRMGGAGGALDAALSYSNWVFAGAVLVWLFNSLAAVIRGTGNMALAGAGHVRRRAAAGAAVGAADLRLRAGTCAGHRRRCRRAAVVLPGGQPGAGAVPGLAAQPAAPGAARAAAALGAVSRHPAGGPGRIGVDGVDQPVDRRGGGVGGRLRQRGDRRLRHRVAAGIPADPTGLRPGRAAGGDGRHLHRRGAARTRAARRLDRCGAVLRHGRRPSACGQRPSRTPGCACSATTRRCSRPARCTCAASARCMGSSASDWCCTSRRKEPASCCGRCWPTCCAWPWPALGGWLVLHWGGTLTQVFLVQGLAMVVYGLVNAGAVAAGSWFGPLTWPRRAPAA